MKINRKELVLVLVCAAMALGLTLFLGRDRYMASSLDQAVQVETSIVPQSITRQTNTKHRISKLYHKGNLVGVFNDRNLLQEALDRNYEEKYKEEFPDTKLELSADVYFTEENSYFYYENVDEQILKYLSDNELFAIESNRIEFSNGVVLYVKNLEDFEAARNQYLLNYVDYNSLELITNNQLPPELISYGERIIDIQVAETYKITQEYTAVENIKNRVQDILYFLCYGYGTEINTYESEGGETVERIAGKNGLTAQQLITLNSEILKKETQLVAAGTVLNVTFYNSPINVVVTKERVAKEVVYAGSTKYVANSSMREGMNRVVVREEDGSKNVYYKEVYINGELFSQQVLSEEITLEPIREVVEYGTKIIPGVGTGKFRWPVDHPRVTCHWHCYNSPKYGIHEGVDIINTKTKYAPIYAADRGTIQEVGYNAINGYYVYINHNNGYRTYYGHMNSKCYFPVGTNVNKGEVIGQLGRTGAATGVHVHFVIYTGKTKNDACRWLGC